MHYFLSFGPFKPVYIQLSYVVLLVFFPHSCSSSSSIYVFHWLTSSPFNNVYYHETVHTFNSYTLLLTFWFLTLQFIMQGRDVYILVSKFLTWKLVLKTDVLTYYFINALLCLHLPHCIVATVRSPSHWMENHVDKRNVFITDKFLVVFIMLQPPVVT